MDARLINRTRGSASKRNCLIMEVTLVSAIDVRNAEFSRGSKVVGFAGQQQVQPLAGGFEFFNRGRLVDLNGRKGVVMQAEDVVATNKLGGSDGVLDAHGEVVSEAQGSESEPG